MNPALRPFLLGSLLFAACGGRYDVGDSAAAGSGGSSVADGGADTGSGGSATSGTGGTTPGSGGTMSTTGGTGGSSTTGGSDSGGSDSGGSSTSGGTTNTGGTTMVPPDNGVCGVAPSELEYDELAPPSEVWDRLNLFFGDEAVEPFGALPEETTPEWAIMTAITLLEAPAAGGIVPRGLSAFMREKFPASDDEDADIELGERWGAILAAESSTLASLLTSEGGGADFGVFTDAAMRESSISRRGAWVSNELLCSNVPLPPEVIAPLEPGPGQTRREVLAEMVAPPNCAGCHAVLDPPGWAMEILEPETGALRTTDNGLPIDASGSYTTQNGESYEFADVGELAFGLSTSCEVARCLVTQLFDRAVNEAGIAGYDQSDVDWVVYQFATDDRFALRDALLAVVQTPSFLR